MLEHVMIIFERIIELRVREKAKIDNMQFGFNIVFYFHECHVLTAEYKTEQETKNDAQTVQIQ